MSNILKRCLLQNKPLMRFSTPVKANMRVSIKPSAIAGLMTRRSKVHFNSSTPMPLEHTEQLQCINSVY